MCCGQWGDPLPIAVPIGTKKETWFFPIFAYPGHDRIFGIRASFIDGFSIKSVMLPFSEQEECVVSYVVEIASTVGRVIDTRDLYVVWPH